MRLFYFVSGIINYDFDLSVFRFPKSGVKMCKNNWGVKWRRCLQFSMSLQLKEVVAGRLQTLSPPTTCTTTVTLFVSKVLKTIFTLLYFSIIKFMRRTLWHILLHSVASTLLDPGPGWPWSSGRTWSWGCWGCQSSSFQERPPAPRRSSSPPPLVFSLLLDSFHWTVPLR